MDKKILGSLWFTERREVKPIGIILIETGYGKKAYIGTGWGASQAVDEQKIADTGAKFPTDVALKLFGMDT